MLPVIIRAEMREWLEVSVSVPAAAADAVNVRLFGLGAPGVIEEAAGERTQIRAHFPADHDGEALAAEIASILSELEAFFPGCAADRPSVTRLVEDDWAEGWKRGFPPIEAGRRLRVRTPWTPAVTDGRLEIEILPAMAFGTGQHASTLGCLLELDTLAGSPPGAVLDVGTGSGILAIAAARLGARRVLALDTDPVAVDAARENVARNGVGDVVTVVEGAVAGIDERFDLILANLHRRLLCDLFGELARVATKDAQLVAAGLLDADRPVVAAAARDRGWHEVRARSLDGWTTLVLSCRDF